MLAESDHCAGRAVDLDPIACDDSLGAVDRSDYAGQAEFAGHDRAVAIGPPMSSHAGGDGAEDCGPAGVGYVADEDVAGKDLGGIGRAGYEDGAPLAGARAGADRFDQRDGWIRGWGAVG